MRYLKTEAKSYARKHLRGIWAATLTPFTSKGDVDEAGFLSNLDHWIDDLAIDGFFVGGKQGEFFSMSLPERKRQFEVTVAACRDRAGTILSCSDQNLDVVLELGRHAQTLGADFIVVHAPVLHFVEPPDETVFAYYRHISEVLDIGVAMWSHPDSGYLMSPELCARIAELPNIVGIKYSVPREMYARLTSLVGDQLIVSTNSEKEWFDNIVELGWQVYLCSTPPFLMQTKVDRRMKAYTDLAFAGDIAAARAARDSLDPVRRALRDSRPPGKNHAHQKYWQELLGQVGGRVRRPLLELTPEEKAATEEAFRACGLQLEPAAKARG
ncbi:MAG TPA: dihydrodipicolinate synthase family protein [Steroidobacteraceae bacterium]|nr:dihydrodipicolinate synthase family protein [Steroidobacteraceae bacterium]